MKGLIIKDFINLKKNIKMFGLLTILYGVMTIVSKDANFFSSILTMLFAILTLSLYSYDDMAKWDVFAQTLPLNKDDIVQSKYIMMLLLTLIGAVYSTMFTIVFNIMFKEDSVFYNFESIGIGAAVVILFYSIILPFITKLGVEKARIILFTVYLIPFVGIISLQRLIKDGNLEIPEEVISVVETMIRYSYIMVPLIVMIALAISYSISLRIYRKKEF